MIDRTKLSAHDLECVAVFDGIKPFTITVTTPEDTMFLAEALLYRLGCKDESVMDDTLKLIAKSCKELGSAEEGVKLFFNAGKEKGRQFPAFMVPMFVHLFSHMMEKAKL